MIDGAVAFLLPPLCCNHVLSLQKITEFRPLLVEELKTQF